MIAVLLPGTCFFLREAHKSPVAKMRELGISVIDPVLRIQYQPTEKDLEECKRLGKDLANKVKGTK